ncbi:hypothetical protein [Gimesia panareensis]|uniref:hypothetical protein n=1 Tax=Gimesia panareensis TaxID=2527978 RepID=UPI001187C7E7|nr:hypothetical protein [Gimesia panareensis]QDU52931.1 hypothetical protein Pan110_53130 [Gimesia panareensis]
MGNVRKPEILNPAPAMVLMYGYESVASNVDNIDGKHDYKSGDIDFLRAELRRVKNERDDLADSLKSLTQKNTALSARLRKFTTEINGNSRKQINTPSTEVRLAKLLNEKAILARDLKGIKGRLAQYNDRFLKPLKSAKLIVKIRTPTQPDSELDLDLYVQDPRDEVCYWMQPRILDQKGERATLMPSEDLDILGLLDVNGPTPIAEEVYYVGEPIVEHTQKPYLVFCMIRKEGVTETEPIRQNVEWEIILKSDKNQIADRLVGKRMILNSGAVLNSELGIRYPGLTPLTGFVVIGAAHRRIEMVSEKELPVLFREWTNQPTGEHRKPLVKLRDKE